MELLKELKREKIKILVDDKDNPRDFNFFDMRDNATYTLKKLLGAKIEIKSWSIEPCEWNKDMNDLVLYSENGNGYKPRWPPRSGTKRIFKQVLRKLYERYFRKFGIL